MGVLGFAPFLQKQFPEVIRELPQRLRSLSGKTIAIDGTLITQRLHFAPMPCENRHILGWYRLMRELKECGVGVICVFDGKERNHAKQHETERRRKIHRMDVARGAMEVERSRRLRRLTTLLKHYRALPEPAQNHATKKLQDIILASYGERETRKLNMDSDISLTSESLGPPIPFIVQTESPTLTEPPPDLQPPTQRAPRKASDIVKDEIIDISTSSEEPSTIPGSVSGLRTLKEVLPGYFVTTDAKEADERDGDVILKEDAQTYHVQLPEVSPHVDSWVSDPVAEKSDDGDEDISQSPETQIAPADDVAGVSDAAMFSFEHAQLPFEETPPVQSAPVIPKDDHEGVLDVVGLNSSTGKVDSPSILGSRENLETEETAGKGFREPDTVVSDRVALPGVEVVQVTPSPEAISEGLLALYQDYQQSIPTFMSPPISDPPPTVSTLSEEVSLQEQYAMSRNQAQLTLDEGNLWGSLVLQSPGTFEKIDTTVSDDKLESLAQKSDIISRSYQKRNNPPTQKTYDECKLILRAMGIPCIDTVGPYEAEALAASLVHNGLADYVASEDTDVLVYEAPLLRNLTNRQSPLTLLSGAEVREVLKLDRASYVDFALLLGTDFSQRIKNLGPQRAIKLIRMHGRIEHVIANEPKFIPRVPPDAYLKQVEIARLVFETLPPVPDPETLQPTDGDEEAVIALLEKFGVYRAASVDWDFASALDGNYFGDDPTMA